MAYPIKPARIANADIAQLATTIEATFKNIARTNGIINHRLLTADAAHTHPSSA